jgi:hypothetical protein
MTVYVADTHAHVQRLISVVKMATVLEECTTKHQRCVVRFLWAKVLNAMIFIKKSVLFTVGRVCRVKRFTTWSTNSLNNVPKSQIISD